MIFGSKLNEENFRTTLNSIGDAVITTDSLGKITNINPVAENLTKWKNEEAIGLELNLVFKIVHSKSRKKVSNPVKKCSNQGL